MPDVDTLHKKAAQLEALTFMIYGEGLEQFLTLDDKMKDAVLWLVADLAADVRQLAEDVAWGEAENFVPLFCASSRNAVPL